MSIFRKQSAIVLFLLSCLLGLTALSFSANKKAPATHTIQIVHMQFQPATLTVKKGDKVIFINNDMVVHNVTEQSGKLWRSPDLASGKSWSLVVSKNASYFCSFHPVMKGTIVVK
jgi:plastocyanin